MSTLKISLVINYLDKILRGLGNKHNKITNIPLNMVQEEQKYEQMQNVYSNIVTTFTALDCSYLQWSSGQRSVRLGVTHPTRVLVSYLLVLFIISPIGLSDTKISQILDEEQNDDELSDIFSACMFGNKLGFAHHSYPASLFTISCCSFLCIS